MFKLKFKINPVNIEKNIYTIKMTKGSALKLTAYSLAPYAILLGGLALLGAVEAPTETNDTNEDDSV